MPRKVSTLVRVICVVLIQREHIENKPISTKTEDLRSGAIPEFYSCLETQYSEFWKRNTLIKEKKNKRCA